MKYQGPVGEGANDPYRDPNPLTGQDGSIVGGKAIEHHLRELVHLITAAGLTATDSDLTQVRQAVQIFAAAAASVLPGTLQISARPAPAAGWLLCDGSAISRTAFAGLFAVIGTTYGNGDGASTFNLPDYRGRALVGAGAAPGLTPRALGQTFGAENHVLTSAEMPVHKHVGGAHTHTTPAHSHGILVNATEQGGGQSVSGGPTDPTPDGTVNTNIDGAGVSGSGGAVDTTNAGGGQAHNNVQPSAAANVFIKT